MKTETSYGHCFIMSDHVAITATGPELHDWAHRPGTWWPCSTLARLEQIRVEFDENGLLDLTTSPHDEDIPSDEFNAWSSDVLKLAGLSEQHPVYFVSVGQFDNSKETS